VRGADVAWRRRCRSEATRPLPMRRCRLIQKYSDVETVQIAETYGRQRCGNLYSNGWSTRAR